jgi:ATP-dependent RNA helicase RhlE
VAQTGTGKTAAFALPILHHLASDNPGSGRPIRALMLTPTRELAAQIADRLRVYGRHLPLYSTVVFGGVGQSPQVKALRRGVDILVATPGRLLDLHNQGHVDLSEVSHFVLDEADRMLDMGFSKDVERILNLMPPRRQNLMFSATMPSSIANLANSMLHNPVRVDIDPEAPTTDRIEQYVAFVQKSDKRELLIDLIEGQMVSCGIVFTRTKHGANRLAQQLEKVGISADSIHGDKSQTARTRALKRFRNGEVFILVATDIASRGIDVEDVTHVFNFDLPNEPEVYVHRIGRTARAGREGLAYSFCDETESGYLVGIQRLLGNEIEVLDQQPYHFEKAIPKPGQKPGRVKGSYGGGRANRGTGRGSGMRRYNRGGQDRRSNER